MAEIVHVDQLQFPFGVANIRFDPAVDNVKKGQDFFVARTVYPRRSHRQHVDAVGEGKRHALTGQLGASVGSDRPGRVIFRKRSSVQ